MLKYVLSILIGLFGHWFLGLVAFLLLYLVESER